MKNFLGKKYVQIGITAFCVIAASMLFYFGIFHTASIARGLNTIYTILTPIVYGRLSVLWSAVWFIGSVRKKTGIQLIKYAMRFG